MKAAKGASIKGKAPLPKRGIIRAVVETVQGLGGATEGQVYKYLPASITNSNQVITHKKLKAALISGVYRGYLVHDPDNDHYKLAPLAYYQARCKYFDELPSSDGRAPTNRLEPKIDMPDIPLVWSGWMPLIIIASIAWGFLAGLYVGNLT